MGGATSKFEETDWTRANGKLNVTSRDATLDGALPTTKYQVFYLIKRGVNQREFDVTDEEDNLLYTTRQVPGTISCFDVLGKEMDAFLLRVNVDLARRYWTVCRYQVATFHGQKPDKVATEKVAAERLLAFETESASATAPSRETFNTPLLFRKACITVSWSRYMAVATMFGTPTAAQLAKYNERNDDTDDDEDEQAFELHDSAGATKELKSLFGRASSHITEKIRARTSAATADYYKPIKITGVNRPSNSLGDDEDDSDSNSSSGGNGSFSHDSEGVEVSLEDAGVVAPSSSTQLQNNSSNMEQPNENEKNNDTVVVVVDSMVSALSDKQPEIACAIGSKNSDEDLNDKSERLDAGYSGTTTDSVLLNRNESADSDVVVSRAPSAESGVCSVISTNNATDSGNVDAPSIQEHHVSSTTLQIDNNEPTEKVNADAIKPGAALSVKPKIADAVDLNDKSASTDTDKSGTGAGSSLTKNESTGSDVVLSSSQSAESGVCSVMSSNNTTDSGNVDDTPVQCQQGVLSATSTTTDRSAIHEANEIPVCVGPPPYDPDEVPTENVCTEEAPAIPSQRHLSERPCNSLAKSAPPQAIPKRSRPETRSGINFDADAARTSPITRGADVGKWILQQSRTFRDTYSRPKKPKKEDPMEGVIRLDQPLLLCQEIYTKLIGNHQTSRVSKEKVLELLQQDEAQHQQEKKDQGGNDDGENPDLTQEIMDSAAELAIIDDATNDRIAEYKSDNDSDPSMSRESNGGLASTTDTTEEDIEQPLVGYWKWENTFRTHKMKMHLAKGSDLALHVVLAIVVNQVRYERNAVAITI